MAHYPLRSIRAGIPQRSCLFPELYALYTDDVPTLRAAKKIQRVLDVQREWLDKWRMAVNVSKTAALLTGSQRNMPTQLRLSQVAEWKGCVRYLDDIDRSLRIVLQMDHVIQMGRAARAKLCPLLTSRVPIRTKIAI
ncbi:hypothetical protein EVAR_19227_1 [Eumeta japonica]|uniref:RNA-directed DNA polymerase from mobile element jockey n=1 Tax=Eumeta variegata TaxID=151549 RepID=A0A4C1VD87_EUMVA|nr:hypothetical protein EVAR_19227_1 [Eumeta japonica]